MNCEVDMNDSIFKRNVILVITIYTIALIAGIILKSIDPANRDSVPYNTFKDLVPLIIAIPAAWLSYCFQRRQAYLKDVKDLWAKLAGAVQDAIQYTHRTAPDQVEFGKVLKALSLATEEIRAVFANVGEDKNSVGLFPFESIKSIHKKVSSLKFGSEFKVDDAATVRCETVSLWKKLRSHYLSELERGVPANIDSPFLR
jgi:hypothetical protein